MVTKFETELRKWGFKIAAGLGVIALITACTSSAGGTSPLPSETQDNTPQQGQPLRTETAIPLKPSATASATGIPEFLQTVEAMIEEAMTEAAPTVTRTSTVTATQAPLGNIPGCLPLDEKRLEDFAPVDASGNLVTGDEFDAWHLLEKDLTLERKPVDVLNALNCFALQSADAYARKFFKPNHNTTYEKFAAALGLKPEELVNRLAVGINFVHRDESEATPKVLQDSLNSPELTGIFTSGENISQTFVELSEQLAVLGRKLRPDSNVSSPEQIAQQLVNTYNLEDLWRRGIKKELVDEIGINCFTIRPDTGEVDRLNQPRGVVKALWREGVVPGQETIEGEVNVLSPEDGMLVVANVTTSQEEYNDVVNALNENDFYATILNISENVNVFVQVFDLRNEQPNTDSVNNAINSKGVGSGNQLVPCGVNLSVAPTAVVQYFTPVYPNTQPAPRVTPNIPGTEVPPISTHPVPPTDTQPVPSTSTNPVPTTELAPTGTPPAEQPSATIQAPRATTQPAPVPTASREPFPTITPEPSTPMPPPTTPAPAATQTPFGGNVLNNRILARDHANGKLALNSFGISLN